MIHVNLLRNRKEGQRMVVEPSGASAFISGREVLLAAVFLVLGGAILWFVLSSSPSDTSILAANEEPAGEAAAAAAQGSPPQDSGVPQTAKPPPVPAQSAAPQTSEGARPAASPLAQNAAIPAGTAQVPSTTAAARNPPATTPPIDPARVAGASAPARAKRPPAPAASPAPRGGEITLRELRISNVGGGIEVFAATNGLPEYDMFRVENPSRVVIDLPGVRHEVPRENRDQVVTNSVVKQVRIAQNQLDPPLVRLVLEVTSFPELQVLPRPDGLLIHVASQ